MRQPIRDKLISGKELRQARLEVQLSLKDAEKLSGISKGRIQRIETGAAPPTFSDVIYLAISYRKSLSELLESDSLAIFFKAFAPGMESALESNRKSTIKFAPHEVGFAQQLTIACAGDTDFKRRLGEVVWWQNAVVLGKEFASRKETAELDLSKTVELAILARRHDATCAVKIEELLETTTIPDAVAHAALAEALKSDDGVDNG